MTQQNAALVEESTAAAEKPEGANRQAGRAVAIFRLREGEGRSMGAAPHACITHGTASGQLQRSPPAPPACGPAWPSEA